MLRSFIVPSLLAVVLSPATVWASGPCRPVEFGSDTPLETPLGRAMATAEDKMRSAAEERFSDINWMRWVAVIVDDVGTSLLDRQTARCELTDAKRCECSYWMWARFAKESNDFKEIKISVRARCDSHEMYIAHAIGYKPDGLTSEEIGKQQWTTAVPDSRGEAELDRVCFLLATDFRFAPIPIVAPQR